MPRKKQLKKKKVARSGAKAARRWELFREARDRGLKVSLSTTTERLEELVGHPLLTMTHRKVSRKKVAPRAAAPRKTIEKVRKIEGEIDLTYARLYRLAEKFGHAMGLAFGEAFSKRAFPQPASPVAVETLPVSVQVTCATAACTDNADKIVANQAQVVEDVLAAGIQAAAPDSVPPNLCLDLTETRQCSVDCCNQV